MNPDEYLTPNQIAEMLGVKANTFHSYVTRGQAPAPDLRVGSHPIWMKRTIEDWMGRRRSKRD